MSRDQKYTTAAVVMVAAVLVAWLSPATPAPEQAEKVEEVMQVEVTKASKAQEPAPVAASRLGEALPPAPAIPGRPAEEWQGMRIDAEDTWPCLEGFCSMARACIEGRCVGCTTDADCASKEACVLDHCVLAEQVECRRTADCTELEAKCVLSGITTMDPRGNRDMKAYCLSPSGGSDGPEAEASVPHR